MTIGNASITRSSSSTVAMNKHDHDMAGAESNGPIDHDVSAVGNVRGRHRVPRDPHDMVGGRALDEPLAEVDELLEIVGRRRRKPASTLQSSHPASERDMPPGHLAHGDLLMRSGLRVHAMSPR